jgi:hypothetical protein
VKERSGMILDPNVFTIGLRPPRGRLQARRPRAEHAGPSRHRQEATASIQLVYAGKAHPDDPDGKNYLKSIFSLRKAVAPEVEIAFIPNYDLEIGLAITTGPDIWLNTPIPPREASGTSGMKSAHNGVPSLSILDGWWCEGHVEERHGLVHRRGRRSRRRARRRRGRREPLQPARELVLPLYHKDRKGWISVMRHAIALNAPYFNTHRMVHEYTQRAYFPKLRERAQHLGLHHSAYEGNSVKKWQTVLQNLKGAITGWPQNVRTYFELVDSFEPDVVISDFESFSYLFAKNHLVPVISVDNMQIINRCRHEPSLLAGHEDQLRADPRHRESEAAGRLSLPDHHVLLPAGAQRSHHAGPVDSAPRDSEREERVRRAPARVPDDDQQHRAHGRAEARA